MAALINKDRESNPSDRPRPAALFVLDTRYANSAAKFWPSLIDEIQADFAECASLELTTHTTSPFSREQLFPHISLERDLDSFLGRDMDETMANILAELEILGPPTSVQIRLLAGDREVHSQELSLDCVDSETFPFLVVWPLEWSGIPETKWNDERLHGNVTAEDRKRRLVYCMNFDLTNTHVSEGLYKRTMSVAYSVEAWSETTNTSEP
jgi:hypothetical protein